MAKGVTFEAKLKACGFCCKFGFMNISQRKGMRGHRRTSANYIAAKFDLYRSTVLRAREAFDKGKLMCEGLPHCQKGLFAKDDKGQAPVPVWDYPARFVLDDRDYWLITFRDFPEVKEYCSPNFDKLECAAEALGNAIDERIKALKVVPLPGRPWEGDRMVTTPQHVAIRMADYKKFFMAKRDKFLHPPESEY